MAITKVTTDVITDLAVTAPKLAADSVITAKIADNAVTAAKIAAGALGDQVAGISSSASATTIAGTLSVTGAFTSPGIDDNADATAITIDSSENVTMTGNLLIADDSANTEKSLLIRNTTVTSMIGVEGSSANRFVSSAANNMFLGTTSADGMELATNNTVRAVIDSSGKLGVGVTTPASGLHLSGADNTASKITLTNTANSNTYSIHPQHNAHTLKFQEDGTTVLILGTGGKLGVGDTVDPTRRLTVKSAGANATQISLVDNDSTNEVFAVGQQSDGDGFLQIKLDDGTGKVLFDASGDSYVAGGSLHIGSTNSIASSAEVFSVYNGSTGHTRLKNASDSYGTLYMENSSTTANTFQPSIILVKGGGNRGNIGVRHTDSVLGVAGQGGISLRHGATSLQSSDEIMQANGDNTTHSRPILSKMNNGVTDNNCKHYTHVASADLYGSGTGYSIIDTNIPHYDASNANNMFQISLKGFVYANEAGGIVDFNIGGYSGEGAIHNASCSGTNIPNHWKDEIHFARKVATGTVSIILGTSSHSGNMSLAVTDFIQSYSNEYESYAKGWKIYTSSSLSAYDRITDVYWKENRNIAAFRAYLTSSASYTSGTRQFNGNNELTQAFDHGNNFNPVNGRFTCRQPGIYHFNAAVGIDASTTFLSYHSAEIVLNNSTRYVGGWTSKPTSGTTAYAAAHHSITLSLSTGDYVTMGTEISSAVTILGASHSHTNFSGHLVG